MSNSHKSRIDPAIIAALIGVCGTVTVTLISLFINNQPVPVSTPTPQPTWTAMSTSTNVPPPIPTDTVPAGNPSSTPAPDTPTPEPTSTLAPPAIGLDWVNGCISAFWVPYPSTIQTSPVNGCLSQPVDKFYTSNGRLVFPFIGRAESSQIYGLFAPLPSNGTVNLSTLLTEIENGEVLVGIFAEPDPTSNGLLLVFPAGNNVKKQRVILETMPDGNVFSQTDGPLEATPPIYDAFLDFNGETVAVKMMNQQIDLGAVPLASANKWLFLGYQVSTGSNRLQAEFYSPIIQPR